MKHVKGCRAVFLGIGLLLLCGAALGQYEITASSFMGGSGENDAIFGARIQSDGTIVLGGNLGEERPGGQWPILLNGVYPGTPGTVVRLSPDGDTILSVTRLCGEIWDMAIDGNDNIYLATGVGGLVKLNAEANAVVWTRLAGQYVYRVDLRGYF